MARMASFLQCIFICIAFLICSGFTAGRTSSRTLLNYHTIVVDPSTHTGFSTIQAAIDSVPSNNKDWVFITVKAGLYNEKVKIPPEKPFIYLKGEGIGKTNVTWGDNDTIMNSSTFASMADNIVVSGITFVNSYNYPPNKGGNPVKPAVAAQISGDKSAFYECEFLGYQDTLLDDEGRHYFKLCSIEGAIDFIFGNGQSIYEDCRISVNVGLIEPHSTGFIAAHARASSSDPTGFVFNQCNVSGKGKTFLGRAWKAYSRAVYYNSSLSDIIVPQGWDAWTFVGQENQITFAEEQCQGSGSDKSNRVKWMKDLDQKELQSITNLSFIDSEGWIPNLPLKF